MHVLVADIQTVGETQSTLLSTNQTGTTNLVFLLCNVGINTMNYIFQGSADGGMTWTNLGAVGTAFYGTLMPGQSLAVSVLAATQRLQLVGNASGGAILDFSLSRYYSRPSGGFIP